MLPWIFKKALERDAKFNDTGRDEDFAPVFNVGDEMDAPLNGVNAPNWLTHTQLKGNVRHEN